jgi:hypothetical protein
VSSLFPVASLPARAWVRHDAAAERLESVPADAVLAVAPESMATGYKLAQTPLTVVLVDELPASVRDSLLESVNVSLRDYRLLVLGRPEDRANHRLREYA